MCPLQCWLDSGRLLNRGRGAGKYCLARLNDLGSYAPGNLEVLTWEENSRKATLGRSSAIKSRESPMRGRAHQDGRKRLQRAEAG